MKRCWGGGVGRRCKKDVDIGSIQVDVCLSAFDSMYLHGEQLLDRPFRERRGLLRSMFIEMHAHKMRPSMRYTLRCTPCEIHPIRYMPVRYIQIRSTFERDACQREIYA